MIEMIKIKTLLLKLWIFSMAELMIETFEFCNRNHCVHYGCKDILI